MTMQTPRFSYRHNRVHSGLSVQRTVFNLAAWIFYRTPFPLRVDDGYTLRQILTGTP
jgi:hypothetical protein